MLILTQKLFNHIPNSYPVACEDGWLFDLNANETRVNCTNQLCPIDNSLKLDRALDILEIKCKVGPKRALQLIEVLQLEHHMDIFNKIGELHLFMEDLSTNDVTNLTEIVNYMEKIEDNPIDLTKFMHCWGLEQLGSTNSQKIFLGLSDLKEFYDIASKGRLEMNNFVGHRLGISEYSDTVNIICKFMRNNKSYLLKTADNFKFKKPKTGNIVITITGEISLARREDGSLYKPRPKFAEELSDKYVINISYNNHITQKTDYLICDNDNGFTKINKVKSNPKFEHVQLMTSKQFEDYVKSLGKTENKITKF